MAENAEYIAAAAATAPLDRHTTQLGDYTANNNPTSRLYNLNTQAVLIISQLCRDKREI